MDFSSQETRNYGRHHREVVPTERGQTYNAEKENRRLAREAAAAKGLSKQSRAVAQPLTAHAQGHATGIAASHRPSSGSSQHSAPPVQYNHSSPEYGLREPRLYLTDPREDPAAYGRPPLERELDPRNSTHQDTALDAAERAEMLLDPHANDDDESSDEEGHTQTVSIDEGLRDLPQANNQISSVPVNLSESEPSRRVLVRRTVNPSTPAISSRPPTVAYHTPTPTIPYATNPRNLVRRTHVFVPAHNSSDPRSSPTPVVPNKRPISAVGGRDERDDPTDSDSDNGNHDPNSAVYVHAADLPPVRRRIFDVGTRHMRLLVVSEGPYADGIQLDKMALGAWYASLEGLKKTHGYQGSTQPSVGELDLLKARSHQVKGDIKTVCRDVVLGKKGYDLRPGNTPEDVQHNRQYATDLLKSNAFLYSNPGNRNLPGTLWEHSALQEVLNRVFYKDESNSEAVLTPEYFAGGLPLMAAACIANGLECAITEYQTGTLVKSRMSAKVWQPKFEKHLKILEDWKIYTTNSGSHLTQKLMIRMVQDARKNAKVDVTATRNTALGISTMDFEKNEA